MGTPPPGYRVTAQTVSPPTLRVSGPESRVTAVQNAETDLVDIGGVIRGFERTVNAFVADSHAQFQSRPVVTVKVVIEKIEGNP